VLFGWHCFPSEERENNDLKVKTASERYVNTWYGVGPLNHYFPPKNIYYCYICCFVYFMNLLYWFDNFLILEFVYCFLLKNFVVWLIIGEGNLYNFVRVNHQLRPCICTNWSNSSSNLTKYQNSSWICKMSINLVPPFN